MFETVLVANRGEIAVRIMRTLRSMGIRSVAVFTDADAGARHVRAADAAVGIGPSYLDVGRVVDAARSVGAQALHPGYGFLAENPALAAACAAAGVVFVGPPASAIEAMGDKITAKQTVAAAGVPVVPGRDESGLSDEALAAAAAAVGYPVLLKPSAGGGGKGMRRVDSPDRIADEIAAARREAVSAFGDGTLLVERFVDRPRHIEIQVLADAHGDAVHLGERECSLQRRHQKIVEEAPSALLTPAQRGRMGAAACDAARSVGYVGAGTVEFLVPGDRPDEFFFMEMNTRLQVEHPVTELVTGLDLVELQLHVAAGERLPFGQDDVRLDGHAVEARVYAEDPARGFLPTGGRVLRLREPAGDGVRVDSGIDEGDVVGSAYDPMLAKVIAWGPDRGEALRRLRAALGQYVLLGMPTNIAFLRALLGHRDVVAGRLDTGLVERDLDALVDPSIPDHVLAAAALLRTALDAPPAGAGPWDRVDGWRLGGRAWVTHRLVGDGEPIDVALRTDGDRHQFAVTAPEPRDVPGRSATSSVPEFGRVVELGDAGAVVDVGGVARRYAYAVDGDVLLLGCDGRAWAVRDHEPTAGDRGGHDGEGGPVVSPMPGSVVAVFVSPGDDVSAGDPLVAVEAMKMEHSVNAPVDGTVTEVLVEPGQQVAMGERLAVVAAAGSDE